MSFGLFNTRFGGANDPADGLIGNGDSITVANYAALPDASTNNGKLAWVLSDSGALWTKKYAGWYVSNGSSWNPATLPDDQYVITSALQTTTTAGESVVLQAYDTDGGAYTTFATLTANNTPTFNLSSAATCNNINITSGFSTAFGITIDGGGSAITTGVKGYVEIPYGMTITGWTITGDTSGSIVVDVWKDTYANFPPTVADTIAGSEKPTISSSTKGQDLTLSSWTTTVSSGDVIGFNVDSCTSITKCTLVIRGTKT